MPTKGLPVEKMTALRQLREKRGLTITRLSELSHIWNTDLSRFEHMERRPNRLQAKSLARVFFPDEGSQVNRAFRVKLLYPEEFDLPNPRK